MEMLHRKFADRLNIVIIEKINLSTGKIAHVNLFSTDLTLDYEKIIDYYSLRFQIEFVFRDAKQYWGMEDFMNIKKHLSIIGQISLLLWSISLMDYAKILI
ncbi:MAG: hypothetical protein Q9M39_03645 [Sulfurovum sp.]|nr:hypothetical protein [Sulfurovum sp.]